MSGRGSWSHVRTHARALGLVGAASIIGAVAAFAFQVLTARTLGAEDFSLLAAFFAIVNVAAVGSSAVQNSVAVQTAVATRQEKETRASLRVPADAALIGLLGGIGVVALSGVLSRALDASVGVVLAAAACIPLSFLFAVYIGRIQGVGSAGGAVGWSTTSLVLRVAVALPLLFTGAGISGAVGAVLLATGVAVIGAAWWARRAPSPRTSIFGWDGLSVMVITVAVAWLTSSDVFFLRITLAGDEAGAYAAAAALVKASFILPSTLSMYLLPRFARNKDRRDLTRVGVGAALGLSAAGGVGLLLLFALIGGPLTQLLYGDGFAATAGYLVPVAAAYLPWIVLQGTLIQLTSVASRTAAIVLLVAVGLQTVLFLVLLPDVSAALLAFAALGTVLCLVLIGRIFFSRRPRAGKEQSSEQSA